MGKIADSSSKIISIRYKMGLECFGDGTDDDMAEFLAYVEGVLKKSYPRANIRCIPNSVCNDTLLEIESEEGQLDRENDEYRAIDDEIYGVWQSGEWITQERGKGRQPREYTHAAHYGDSRSVYLPQSFDLKADHENPRRHTAILKDHSRRSGRKVVVVIDHNATATATTGTGDTVCRSVPRGWQSGDRRFAD